MAEEKAVNPDGQTIIYTIASLGPDRWFVDSTKGTSGYSFHSLAEAERFAITLAQRNAPSKVCILDTAGAVVTEMAFDQAPDAGAGSAK